MAEKNERNWLLVAVLIFCQIVFIASIFVPEITTKALELEVKMMLDFYGYKDTDKLYDLATSLSTRAAIDSGIIDSLKSALLPRDFLEFGVISENELGTIGFWQSVSEGIDGLYLALVIVCLRIVSLQSWAYIAFICIVSGICTGLLQRDIKKTGYEFSSPLIHHWSRNTIRLLPFLFCMFVTFPLAVSPVIYPVTIVMMTLTVMLYLSNTIKRA